MLLTTWIHYVLSAPLCLQPGCFLLPVQVAQKVLSYYRQRARNYSSLVKFLLLEQHGDEPQRLSSPGYPLSGCLVDRCPTRRQFSDLTVTGLVRMARKLFECTSEMFLLFNFLDAAFVLPQHHQLFSLPTVHAFWRLSPSV